MPVSRQNAVESEAFEGEISDEATGLVRGVKLLGIRSRNKRNYDTPGVRRTAKVLLEGAKVYIDHPETPGKPRSYRDSFGVVKNVHYRDGQGHFGDLSYNPSHPLANQFAWDVKNNPKGLGMSVNAFYLRGKIGKDGFESVEGLELIRSVDIVTKPATSEGIFESEDSDIVSEEEDEVMDLKTLKEKHGDLLEQIRADVLKESSETSEATELQKKLAEATEQLAALKKAEEDRKHRETIEADFGSLFESLEFEPDDDLRKNILECACQMTEEARKPYRTVVEAMAKLIPSPEDSDEDDEEPVVAREQEEEEPEQKPTPRYRPGRVGKPVSKGSGGSFDLAKAIGVTRK